MSKTFKMVVVIFVLCLGVFIYCKYIYPNSSYCKNIQHKYDTYETPSGCVFSNIPSNKDYNSTCYQKFDLLEDVNYCKAGVPNFLKPIYRWFILRGGGQLL